MILQELEYLYNKIPNYNITDKLSIKHPTYKEIIEYGEDKYIQLLYILCLKPDDYKSELFDQGYNWYEMDELSWFYFLINRTVPDYDLSIIFSLDIRNYMLYENIKTKELVLYNCEFETDLNANNIKLIKEHINSMIGNMYKEHKEKPANDITKNILIDEDRHKKKINSTKEKYIFSIKDVIASVLMNKFHNDNLEEIEEITGCKNNCLADHAFRLGELNVTKKIADYMYMYLRNK
jgi:hypothetical protein